MYILQLQAKLILYILCAKTFVVVVVLTYLKDRSFEA